MRITTTRCKIFLHLACLFIIAINCHGKIAQAKPKAEFLTSYYFWLALGGALGGAFSTAAPYLFNDIYEYPIILLLSLSIPLGQWLQTRKTISLLRKTILAGSGAAIAISMVLIWTESKDYPAQYQARNFFGVKKVIHRDYPSFIRTLEIGSTVQGYQPTFPGHELAPE